MVDYRDILRAAGYPEQVLVLDFETYFDKDYSLSKLSTVEYVRDPRFEVMGMGVWCSAAQSLTPDFLDPAGTKLFLDSTSDLMDSYTIVGQHLQFDALILRERYGITPKYTVDILDLARHLDARDKHGLDHLAKRYGAPTPKGDTSQFLGLHWAAMTPEQRAALADYCCNDVAIEAYLFQTLLPRLTNPTTELRLASQTLRNFLVPQIRIDSDLGHRLQADMRAELQRPVDELNELGLQVIEPCRITKRTSRPPVVRPVTVEDISKDSMFLKLLASALPEGESIPMKQGKVRMIPALAKTDTALDYLLKHPSAVVRRLMEARKGTDSWPSHISRVQKLIDQSAARGGFMGAPLTYYGAHTGRWSGRDGVNFQNFGAREEIHPLVRQVGQMLIAPDGYVFGCGDLSQIEARVVAWLAGQDDLVAQFAAGEDVYSRFAAESVFHAEVRKPKPEDPPDLASLLRVRRAFGKMTTLACGFGMGAETFKARCMGDKDLRPSFDSGEYDVRFCHKIVNLYRNRYSMIPAYWKEVENAWKYVAKYHNKTATVSHNGHAIQFRADGSTVVVELPSSRCLFYPHAAVANVKYAYKKPGAGYGEFSTGVREEGRYHWGKVYGGILVENIVQAVARDVFGEGLVALEDAGLNPVFSVHDQAVCLLPVDAEHTPEDMLDQMRDIQCRVPVWAKGLPVAVECELTDRFHR